MERQATPIVREYDGLALSSRNVYLDTEDRAVASLIYQSLRAAQQALSAGERNARALARIGQQVLQREPCFRIQYWEVVEPRSLQPIGDFEIDEVASTYSVRVKSSLARNLIGTTVTVRFDVEGDTLVLMPVDPSEAWQVVFVRK